MTEMKSISFYIYDKSFMNLCWNYGYFPLIVSAWTRGPRYDASADQIGVRAARASTRSLSRPPPAHGTANPHLIKTLIRPRSLYLLLFLYNFRWRRRPFYAHIKVVINILTDKSYNNRVWILLSFIY